MSSVARPGERLRAPRVPVDRVVGVLEEVRARLAGEPVRWACPDGSAATGPARARPRILPRVTAPASIPGLLGRTTICADRCGRRGDPADRHPPARRRAPCARLRRVGDRAGRAGRRHRLGHRPARPSPRAGQDGRPPVGARQPARAVHLDLRAPGRARRRRPDRARRVDPRQQPARPRAGLLRRRARATGSSVSARRRSGRSPSLLVLAVAALAIPTLATAPGAPDAGHAQELSVFTAVVLLVLFAASIPFSIAAGPGRARSWHPSSANGRSRSRSGCSPWRRPARRSSRTGSSTALEPSLGSLGISEAFAGLVVVAHRRQRRRERGRDPARGPEPGRPGDQPDHELEPPGRAGADAGARDHQPRHRRTGADPRADARSCSARWRWRSSSGRSSCSTASRPGSRAWPSSALYLIVAASVWYGPVVA